jgi:1-acyl-sn-glycerol-3-phosphate acyltransferase
VGGAHPTNEMNGRQWIAWLWYAILWCPCYAISQVFFRFCFSGKNQIPLTGPVLVVSNHQSNLDPVLVGLASTRQLKYLARIGLFFFPFNLWIRALGAVPIDRDKGALAGIRKTLELLKQGNAVLVFPEGSRTPDGRLQEMLPGFCLLARKSRATIVPVAIDGAFAALPRGSFLVRPHAVSLAFEAPITAAQYEQLSDVELTELVTKRIGQAFVRAQREKSPGPRIPRVQPAKSRNRLLAVPSAIAGESNNSPS